MITQNQQVQMSQQSQQNMMNPMQQAVAQQNMQQQQQPMLDQQQMQQQQQQQPPPPPQQQQPQDNISKAKSLFAQLQEVLSDTLRSAGANINTNAQIEQGLKNAGHVTPARYEDSLEKFYSICDQMELHLKTARDNHIQMAASHHYTPTPVNATHSDNQKYTHYTNTAKGQIMYAREIHNQLVEIASNVSYIPSSRPANETITSMETSS